jgi:hypothetical protein
MYVFLKYYKSDGVLKTIERKENVGKYCEDGNEHAGLLILMS